MEAKAHHSVVKLGSRGASIYGIGRVDRSKYCKTSNFNWTLLIGHKVRAKTKLKPCMPPELGWLLFDRLIDWLTDWKQLINIALLFSLFISRSILVCCPLNVDMAVDGKAKARNISYSLREVFNLNICLLSIWKNARFYYQLIEQIVLLLVFFQGNYLRLLSLLMVLYSGV